MARAYAHHTPDGRVVFFTSQAGADASRRSAGGGKIEVLDVPTTLGGVIGWLNERATQPPALNAPAAQEAPASRDDILDAEMVELQKRVIDRLADQLENVRTELKRVQVQLKGHP